MGTDHKECLNVLTEACEDYLPDQINLLKG